jgi:putative ABC transport system permease protein
MLRDLEEDIRDHIARETQDNIDRGMPPDEARYAALRKFGNVAQVMEETREVWAVVWLEQLLQDLRFNARVLRKTPGFTLVAILTLALGIGANTAIFSVLNGVLLRPLPYPNPQQLIAMKQNESLQNLLDIQRQTRTFSQGGGINIMAMDYTDGLEPIEVRAASISAGFLETLGIAPMIGRMVSPAEDVKGGPRNIVASYQFWQDRLGSDPNVLGKKITLSGNSYTIIGVMPASFKLPRERADVFVSLWVAYPEAAAYRGVHFMHTYWRLKPGVTLTQAETDMASIDQHLAEQYPDNERDRRTVLLPLHELLVGNIRPALLILFGAVGLVLLIACANFAGLLMARAVARRQEFVVRAALGAGHGRLLRQATTESGFLALVGGSAGLLLAHWGTSLLLSLRPTALELGAIQIDGHVLLFVFGISLVTGVVFGLTPAWSAVRADVSESLKQGARTTTMSNSGQQLRRLLVTGEIALALVLLVGAGLLIKGFARLRSVDSGFNPANVLTMRLQLPATRYAEIPPQTQFRRQVLAGLNALHGVEAAMITDPPLSGNYMTHNMVIEGRPPLPVGSEPEVQTLSVMGDYFRVMQIPVRAGRGLTSMDREGQPLVTVVNEEFVKEFFPHENPLGARIDWARREGPRRWMTIVGIVGDVKHSGLDLPIDPAVYAPFAQSDEAWRRWMSLVVRTWTASTGVLGEIKHQVWSVDRRIPVSDVTSMDEMMAASLAQQRFNMLLLVLFAALALVLAAVGLYGLMAYAVTQRGHEIGIRMALGAQKGNVLQLILGYGAKLALMGIAIGVAAALLVTRVMTSLLFDVKPTDPAIFTAVAGMLALVALAACYLPVQRALRVQPVIALRYE